MLGVRIGLPPNYTGQEGRQGPRVPCGFFFSFHSSNPQPQIPALSENKKKILNASLLLHLF